MDPKESFEEITISHECSVTYNLGNFNNVKPSFGLTVKLKPGANPNEAKDLLKRTVTNWLDEYIEEVRKESRDGN